MRRDHGLVSKILMLENRRNRQAPLRDICASNHLLPVKVAPSRLMAALRGNVDLGAIICAEDYAGDIEATTRLADSIRQARPELPIVLCRHASADFSGLPEGTANTFCAAFSLADTAPLADTLAAYVFNLDYPNALVRGILDITGEAIASQFPGARVEPATPAIVRDRILSGDLFTLIPIESTWCRGYMLLLADEAPLLRRLAANGGREDFRRANALLGELTNLIWGAFKNRYIGDAAADSGSTIQVPIVVDQAHRYISFGTEDPQLGCTYLIEDDSGKPPLHLVQRFVFNLSWTPEGFREFLPEIDAASDAGELELF